MNKNEKTMMQRTEEERLTIKKIEKLENRAKFGKVSAEIMAYLAGVNVLVCTIQHLAGFSDFSDFILSAVGMTGFDLMCAKILYVIAKLDKTEANMLRKNELYDQIIKVKRK